MYRCNNSVMSTFFLPNSANNGLGDMPASGDRISQCYDQPGLWQFDAGTDTSFRQRSYTASTGIGSHIRERGMYAHITAVLNPSRAQISLTSSHGLPRRY